MRHDVGQPALARRSRRRPPHSGCATSLEAVEQHQQRPRRERQAGGVAGQSRSTKSPSGVVQRSRRYCGQRRRTRGAHTAPARWSAGCRRATTRAPGSPSMHAPSGVPGVRHFLDFAVRARAGVVGDHAPALRGLVIDVGGDDPGMARALRPSAPPPAPARCAPRWPRDSVLRARSGQARMLPLANMASKVARIAIGAHHAAGRRDGCRRSRPRRPSRPSACRCRRSAGRRRRRLRRRRRCLRGWRPGVWSSCAWNLAVSCADSAVVSACSQWPHGRADRPARACQTSSGAATWMPGGASCSATRQRIRPPWRRAPAARCWAPCT